MKLLTVTKDGAEATREKANFKDAVSYYVKELDVYIVCEKLFFVDLQEDGFSLFLNPNY